MILDVASACLLLLGAALALIGAIGVHRFDDSFARMHAATKPVTLAMLLVVSGAILQGGGAASATKLALAALLQLVTVPLGMQLLGRAAYRDGSALPPDVTVDELADEPSPEH